MRRSRRAKLQDGPELAGRKFTVVVLGELRQVRRRDFEFIRGRAIALAGGAVTRRNNLHTWPCPNSDRIARREPS
jgi:hypothetical protein